MNIEEMTIDPTPLFRRKRYLIVFLAFLGYINLYTMRVDLSVAIVALTENRSVSYENGSIFYEQYFDWNSRERGIALSAFFYGYITTQFVGGYVASKFSGRMVFGMGILGSSIMTCCTPILCYQGIFYLYIARIVVGICSGLAFPAVNAIYSKWSTPTERSRFSAFGISGIYVGTVITMLISGWLATNYSWEWIFYGFGIAGFVWSILWFVIVRESPSFDKLMMESERVFILKNVKDQELNCLKKTPWLAIFTSMPVYAVSVAHFAYAWGYYTLLLYVPAYMKDIVNFDLEKSGFVSAIPYLFLTILLLPSGYLADWFQIKNLLSTSQVRKFFNNTSFFGQMVFLLLAGYFTNSVNIVICITLSIGLGAFSMSGFLANTLDIAPQYSSIVLGFSNSIATLPGLVSPILTGYILSDEPSDSEYKVVFFIASGVYLIGIFFYAIYATGKIQPWALPSINEMQIIENDRSVQERK